jgi:hypothetical protein
MTQNTLTRGKVVTLAVRMAFIVALAASYTGATYAQPPAENGNEHLIHVGPNPVSCDGPFAGPESGVVNVHINPTGNFLNLSVHDALPNTLYQAHIRCSIIIGNFTTDSEGAATIQLALPPVLPPTFFIDISVPGGGTGFLGFGDTFIAGPFSN